MSDPSAIVLAGGKSTRLGRDKASEPLLGAPLLQRVISRLVGVVGELVIVRAAGQTLPEIETSLPVRTVDDVYPEAGPLGGIYTGLRTTQSTLAITVACDMPLLQPSLLTELLRLAGDEFDAVVPTNDMDLPEPLCAVYTPRCLDAIATQLEAGALKVALFFDQVRVRYVPPAEWRAWDPQGLSFLNINRDADLRRAEAYLR